LNALFCWYIEIIAIIFSYTLLIFFLLMLISLFCHCNYCRCWYHIYFMLFDIDTAIHLTRGFDIWWHCHSICHWLILFAVIFRLLTLLILLIADWLLLIPDWYHWHYLFSFHWHYFWYFDIIFFSLMFISFDFHLFIFIFAYFSIIDSPSPSPFLRPITSHHFFMFSIIYFDYDDWHYYHNITPII